MTFTNRHPWPDISANDLIDQMRKLKESLTPVPPAPEIVVSDLLPKTFIDKDGVEHELLGIMVSVPDRPWEMLTTEETAKRIVFYTTEKGVDAINDRLQHP